MENINVSLAHAARKSAERQLLRDVGNALRTHGAQHAQAELEASELRAEADTFALLELAERRRETHHALDAAERVLGCSRRP
jgi:hypothetical protein